MQRTIAVAALLACALSPLAAQPKGSIAGVVRGADGLPVPDVALFTRDLRAFAQTDSTGRFMFRDLDTGATRFTARRIGFEPREFIVAVAAGVVISLELRLEATAVMLPA